MIVDPNRARQREALIDTLRWQLHVATGKTLAVLPPWSDPHACAARQSRRDCPRGCGEDGSADAQSPEHAGWVCAPPRRHHHGVMDAGRQWHINRTGYSLRQRRIIAYRLMMPWRSTLPRLLKNPVPW